MSWDEVHDDAEQMEHVVSDRLIERIDEMLGRPEVDPHGDPIPTADGQLAASRARDAAHLPAPYAASTVARVTDQDAAFLRFIESHHLKPGQTIEVEARDEVSDSVRLKGANDAAHDDRRARRIEAAGQSTSRHQILERAIELARMIDHKRRVRRRWPELRRAESIAREHERHLRGFGGLPVRRRIADHHDLIARRERLQRAAGPAGSGLRPYSLSPPMMREKNPRSPSASRMPIDGPSGLLVSTASGPRRSSERRLSATPSIRDGVIHQPAIVDLHEARQRPGRRRIRAPTASSARRTSIGAPSPTIVHHVRRSAAAPRRSPRTSSRPPRPGRAPNRSACRRDQRR